MRALAVTLARAYLTGDGAIRRSFPDAPPEAAQDWVVAATVAGERRLSDDRWLVTVACETARGRRTDYVAIPLRRDDRGSVAMFSRPALVAAPGVTRVDVDEPKPLEGPAATSIEQLVERFLAHYVSGEAPGDLRFLVASGVRLGVVGGLDLVEVEHVGAAGENGGGPRVVVAEVTVRDRATRAVYPLAYRLELVHRDRWYVAGVQGAVQ